MSTNVSRDFATELLKDIVYPEVCPVCGDAIPTAKRIAYHRAMAKLPTCNFAELYSGLVCKS